MKLYPIKKEFYYTFKNKEEILESLIIKQSKQLSMICESIDREDFIYRIKRFYDMENYKIHKNTITYIHPISKQMSYCIISKDHINISDVLGFELFLLRYYSYYYAIDKNYINSYWYSFYHKYSFIY